MTTSECLSPSQFAALVQHYPQRRAIRSIHVHHTRRPDHVQWRGATSLAAMRGYHMRERGLSELAQHLTIDCDGGLWLGRDWNQPPASSLGLDPVTKSSANGTADAGPFMIEIVGDFDVGRDILDGEQYTALVHVLASLCDRFQLAPATCIIAHAQMQMGTPCPGSGLYDGQNASGRWTALLNDVQVCLQASRPSVAPAAKPIPPASIRHLVESARSRTHAATRLWSDEGDVPEDAAAAAGILLASGDIAEASLGARGAVDPRYREIEPHVVNTSHGLLFDDAVRWSLRVGGRFTSTPRDVDEVVLGAAGFDAYVTQQQAVGQPLRLMLHAHGGLANEKGALDYARTHYQWWMRNGVYPVFMVWETGLFETLFRRQRGPGDRLTELTDGALEGLLSVPASFTWEQMKANAARCSSLTWNRDVAAERLKVLGESDSPLGGARVFARALARKLHTLTARSPHSTVEIHAVGHSAGAIFHAHFVPALLQECERAGVAQTVSTLTLLAPAATIALFEATLAPLLPIGGAKPLGIEDCTIFTMSEDLETRDNTARLYRKSLLYFVRNACEPARNPLLGLQESLRPYVTPSAPSSPFTATVMIGGATVHVHFATAALGHKRTTSPGAPNPLTDATAHGDFDNNPATMNAVAARVLGHQLQVGAAPPPIPIAYCDGVESAVCRQRPVRRAQPLSTSTEAPRWQETTAQTAHRALCVGINDYPTAPLLGCVSDANAWAQSLETLQFTVTRLTNGQATLAAIEAAIRTLLESTPDQGHAVFQFAGHGTQLPDTDGDETDGLDEAIVPIDHQHAGCLLDDELYDLLLPHAGRIRISLVFDCCHSGTASRVAPPTAARSRVDERIRLLYADTQTLAAQAMRDQLRGSSHRARAKLRQTEEPTVPWLHLAACHDHQFAYEFGGQGAFTTAALSALDAAVRERWSTSQLVETIRRAVAARGRDQTPYVMPTTDPRIHHPLFP